MIAASSAKVRTWGTQVVFGCDLLVIQKTGVIPRQLNTSTGILMNPLI